MRDQVFACTGDERVDSRGEGVGGARATPRLWGANSAVEKRACHNYLVILLVGTLARGRGLANLTIDLHLPDIVVLILTTVQEVHDLDVPGHVARAVGGSQHWNSGTPSRLPSCLASPAAICFPQISHKTGFRTLATLSEDETAAGSEKNSRPIASAMVEQSSKNELCSLARCA